MLDKIFLRSKEAKCFPSLMENLTQLGANHYGIRDSHYKEAWVFQKFGKQLMTIKTQPLSDDKYPLRIEFNPSKFENITELEKLFLNTDIVNEAEIIRIDHCSDLNLNIADIYTTTRVKFKRGRRIENLDHVSGLYFGKRPEVYLLYDKAYQPKNNYQTTLKPNRDIPRGSLVRLEVRQFDKKTPINHLSEIPKLLEHNPFKKLITVKFSDTSKGQSLEHMCREHGFGRVHKFLNGSNNFNKTYQKHLKPTEIQFDFLKKYYEGIEQFLITRK